MQSSSCDVELSVQHAATNGNLSSRHLHGIPLDKADLAARIQSRVHNLTVATTIASNTARKMLLNLLYKNIMATHDILDYMYLLLLFNVSEFSKQSKISTSSPKRSFIESKSNFSFLLQ